MPGRRYDQNELAAILRSAAEAQASESSGQEPDGLTLNEIERVAAEVGIDPKFIAGAAEKLEIGTPSKRFLLGRTPTREIIERHVDGNLDDAAWEEIVAELRATFGSVGAISQVGASREWVGGTDTKTAHLSATPKNGGLRYRLTLNQQGGVTLGWLGIIVGALLTAILTGIAAEKGGVAGLSILYMVLALMATITLIVNVALSAWHSKNLKAVDAVMDRIKEVTPQQADARRLGSKLETELKSLTERA